MEDMIKRIVRAARQVWQARPSLTVDFFEAKGKEAECFVITITSPDTHHVGVAGRGETYLQALEALCVNLSALFAKERNDSMEQAVKDIERMNDYHLRLLGASIDLVRPKMDGSP